jgi:hypothetical protein
MGQSPTPAVRDTGRDRLNWVGLRTFAGARSGDKDAPTAAILRVANNEVNGIIRETLVSRTMRDLVADSRAAL